MYMYRACELVSSPDYMRIAALLELGTSVRLGTRPDCRYTPKEVGHGHMAVHLIEWESHMKPFSHRVAA